MKEPHTALFVAPTGVGKMHLALNLLENEYRHHFDFIVIICPTLAHNSRIIRLLIRLLSRVIGLLSRGYRTPDKRS